MTEQVIEKAKKQTIGVIGMGVLGRAVCRGFMEHAEVRTYDVLPERGKDNHADAASSDIVFICLPTPAKENGMCDVRLLEQFLHKAYEEQWWRKDNVYVIRSTVPVGFTQVMSAQYLHGRPLLHSPEFLTARCALADFQSPARNIIGYPLTDRAGMEIFYPAIRKLESLYRTRFPGVPILNMQSSASELVKLATNSFFAAKVTMFNLFHRMATANRLNWNDVLAGIMADGRIAHAHTAVPGPDGLQGFGGTCLPKDLANLYWCATASGVDASLLQNVMESNAIWRDDPSLPEYSLLPSPVLDQPVANQADRLDEVLGGQDEP
jgi:UDPglucose 6-dehydrogenase